MKSRLDAHAVNCCRDWPFAVTKTHGTVPNYYYYYYYSKFLASNPRMPVRAQSLESMCVIVKLVKLN